MGEALIALKHDELKEMGIASVGHRLTILKSVYETKVKQDVPLDPDHYIPLCMSFYPVSHQLLTAVFPAADQSMNENATQDDIARLIQSIRLRDEKLVSVASELRRVAEDYRRLREELLPVFKMAKDRSQPLPPPSSNSAGTDGYSYDSQPLTSPSFGDRSAMARTYSKRAYTGGTTPKNHSPTHIPPSIYETRPYNDTGPTAHVNGGAHISPGIPSPTSPHYTQQTLASKSYLQPNTHTRRSIHDHPEDTPTSHSRSDRLNPTPTQSSRPDPSPRAESRVESRAGGENPSVEIFKSFRVSMDDPCHKVLPAALKKYNIVGDWKQYALYIVYGDQERCLGLEERPLILFKQLEKEGRKPMFMLRKHIHSVDPVYPAGGSAPNSAGFDGTRQGQINLPGGVL